MFNTVCSQKTPTSRSCFKRVSQKSVESKLKTKVSKKICLTKRKKYKMVQTKTVSGRGSSRARQTEMAEINSKHKIKTQTHIPAVNRGGRDAAVEKPRQPVGKSHSRGQSSLLPQTILTLFETNIIPERESTTRETERIVRKRAIRPPAR